MPFQTSRSYKVGGLKNGFRTSSHKIGTIKDHYEFISHENNAL